MRQPQGLRYSFFANAMADRSSYTPQERRTLRWNTAVGLTHDGRKTIDNIDKSQNR